MNAEMSESEDMVLTEQEMLLAEQDYEMRKEALGLAMCLYGIGDYDKVVLASAAMFYNFLNGDMLDSNIQKLEDIADILAD